jgi:hypothetical protein
MLDKPFVVTQSVRWTQSAVAALLGGIAVALWYQIDTTQAAPIEQTPMIAACRLPQQNGEMTVFIIDGGKMKCWRWQ